MSKLLQSFWEAVIISGESLFNGQRTERYERSLTLVRVYYFLLFFVSLQSFSHFYQVPNWHQMHAARAMFIPLWSTHWIRYLPWEETINSILLFFTVASFGATWIGTRYRWVRIASSVSLFLYLALISSFGKIDHYLHSFTITSFLFIFLPNHHARQTSVSRTQFLTVFWGGQLWLLASYTSSGIFKFLGITSQLLNGQIHAFHPESLARNVAKGNLNFGYRMFFDTFLIDSPHWIASLLLIGGYFVELLAIIVAFYPYLHRIWGMLLLGLHASILLTVGPDFSLHTLVIGVLLVFSPFSVREEEWFRSWPGSLFGLLRPPPRPLVVFHGVDCPLSQRIVHHYLRHGWPNYIRFLPQSSPEFSVLLAQYPDLINVRTLVTKEQMDQYEVIRIKSEALLWLLGHSYSHKRVYRLLLLLPPVLANLLYDWKARNSKTAGENKATTPATTPHPPQTTTSLPAR